MQMKEDVDVIRGASASGRVQGATVLPAGNIALWVPTHASFSWSHHLHWSSLASGIMMKSRDIIKISVTFYAQGRKDSGLYIDKEMLTFYV